MTSEAKEVDGSTLPPGYYQKVNLQLADDLDKKRDEIFSLRVQVTKQQATIATLEQEVARLRGRVDTPFLTEEPDKFGTVKVWIDERGMGNPYIEAHTTDFDDDGRLVPGYAIYWRNNGTPVEYARRYALAMLKACDIADEYALQRRVEGVGANE